MHNATITSGADAGNNSLAKPGCQEKCGSVSIPYPFGIGDKGCFLEGFEVNCSTGNVPILNTSGTTLLGINVTLSEARVLSPIAWYCNYTVDNGTTNVMNSTYEAQEFIIGPFFTISGTKNMFTGIGCATVAVVNGENKHAYASACGSFCYDEDSIDGSAGCSGMGCCQTAIPGNLDLLYFDFLMDNVDNTQVQNFSPCSYGFVVEEDSFQFQTSYAESSHFLEQYGDGVPLVLDWVVDNKTCVQAMKNQSSYACRADNSVCVNTNYSVGYFCNCSQGYDGNPYLNGGCQEHHGKLHMYMSTGNSEQG
nr:unnamed protein product [Digitaria exilis]